MQSFYLRKKIFFPCSITVFLLLRKSLFQTLNVQNYCRFPFHFTFYQSEYLSLLVVWEFGLIIFKTTVHISYLTIFVLRGSLFWWKLIAWRYAVAKLKAHKEVHFSIPNDTKWLFSASLARNPEIFSANLKPSRNV